MACERPVVAFDPNHVPIETISPGTFNPEPTVLGAPCVRRFVMTPQGRRQVQMTREDT